MKRCDHAKISDGQPCQRWAMRNGKCCMHGGSSEGIKRCGAKVKKKSGKTCQRWAMKNGRCCIHGGKSTGPRTPGGMARSLANLKRGKSGKFGQKYRKALPWTNEELWQHIEGVD